MTDHPPPTDAPATIDLQRRRLALAAPAGALAASAGARRAAAAGLAAAAAALGGPAAAGRPGPWRIPGEFEPQRAIWVGWDATLQDTTAALVRALAPYTPLVFLVPDEVAAAGARDLAAGLGLGNDSAAILVERTAMYYPRDGAVFATGPDRALGVVDFRWNQYGMPAWCQRRHAGDRPSQQACTDAHDTSRDDLDRAIARLAGARTLPSALAYEGGGVESNGQGLLIANEALVRSRNPGVGTADLQRLHLALPGVRRVVWLPAGLANDPHLRGTITGNHVAWGTGGHTDLFVRFASPDTVLLAWPEDGLAASHPVMRLNRQRMERNAAVLRAARTLDGRPLRVLRVPMPNVIEKRRVLSASADRARFDEWTADFFPPRERRREGQAVVQVAAASYLNFVIANGAVVVPDYLPSGTPRAVQQRVQRVFEQAFPGRAIVFVDAVALNWLGGGLHCATLHEPLPA
jgi:agmatine deiminase